MPHFAANLSMMFNEAPFLDRFEAASKAGFDAVEFLFPYDHPAPAIRERLDAAGLRQVLFNMPPGDWAGGERGMAAIPGREAEFRETVPVALRYAKALGCRTLHCMSGITGDRDRTACEAAFVENLRFAADAAAADGITLLIEPINTRNMPGYFVNHQMDGIALIEKVGRPNVALQLDLYHAQIMDGDLSKLIEKLAGRFAHVQVASVPDRHEPGEGELNYPHLYGVLDRVGYEGWIGCEYNPRGETVAGLGWFAPYRAR